MSPSSHHRTHCNGNRIEFLNATRCPSLVSCAHAPPYINHDQLPLPELSQSSRSPSLDHRAAPSARRASANSDDKAAHSSSRGSVPVGLALTTVVGLAFRSPHCQTRNRNRLAPSRIPSVLDLEDSSWPDWTTDIH